MIPFVVYGELCSTTFDLSSLLITYQVTFFQRALDISLHYAIIRVIKALEALRRRTKI